MESTTILATRGSQPPFPFLHASHLRAQGCARGREQEQQESPWHAEKTIVAEYKSAKAHCGSFASNAKDICMAEAKGKQKVANRRNCQNTRMTVTSVGLSASIALIAESVGDFLYGLYWSSVIGSSEIL
jgi:hypothetical protein